MSDDIQSWLDYKEQSAVPQFTNPHETIERLTFAVESLEAELLEALRISREMESEEGVMDSRVKAWRRRAHALLHPNDRATDNPGGEQK